VRSLELLPSFARRLVELIVADARPEDEPARISAIA
jgi:hypothetical protein